MDELFQPLSNLKGVGARRAQALMRLGLETPYDLLYHAPRHYLDYTAPIPVASTQPGQSCVIRVQIVSKASPQYIRKGMTIYKALATDGAADVTVVLYNAVGAFQMLRVGHWYRLSGKIKGDLLRREIHTPRILADTSENLICPMYPLTAGLTDTVMAGIVKQAVAILRARPIEWMPVTMRQRYQLLPLSQALEQIHFPADLAQVEQARRRLAFDELLQLQLGMLTRRAEQRVVTQYPMTLAVDMAPYYNGLPFQLTQGQYDAIQEIIRDLAAGVPMNRLLQGDVGSGKTAVAAAACYFAVQNGIQCAMMAPTEILAAQHHETLSRLLEPLGVHVGLLTGSMGAKARREICSDLMDGTMDLLVGTHAIFQKGVDFQNLGFVITDEQHRFGVAQRAKLADKGGIPHKLVMSATPIPRTLALMIYGDLDISVLRQLPKGRQAVCTFAVTGKLRQRAYGFVRQQLEKGHQAYIVCAAIEEQPDSDLQAAVPYAARMQTEVFPTYRVGLLHGKMKAAEKDRVMQAFRAGEYDILVSTTVIEVGIDVPNATMLLVEDAERFGLSQLHQLRGRVGRGKAQSYCILVTDHVTDDCRMRMQIMSRYGDGFQIAEEDLRLRGPGDFFGQRQHGLPPLKVADLTQDTELLHQVQAAAKEILADDPNLSKPENRGLRIEVMRLFSQVGENGKN